MFTARIAENRIGTVSIRSKRLRSQNLSTVTILESALIYAAFEQARFISNLINSICATLRNLWIIEFMYLPCKLLLIHTGMLCISNQCFLTGLGLATNVKMPIIYTHVLNKGGNGVRIPVDGL